MRTDSERIQILLSANPQSQGLRRMYLAAETWAVVARIDDGPRRQSLVLHDLVAALHIVAAGFGLVSAALRHLPCFLLELQQHAVAYIVEPDILYVERLVQKPVSKLQRFCRT